MYPQDEGGGERGSKKEQSATRVLKDFLERCGKIGLKVEGDDIQQVFRTARGNKEISEGQLLDMAEIASEVQQVERKHISDEAIKGLDPLAKSFDPLTKQDPWQVAQTPGEDSWSQWQAWGKPWQGQGDWPTQS